MLLIYENSFPKADYNKISDYRAEEFYPFPIKLIRKLLKTSFIGHKSWALFEQGKNPKCLAGEIPEDKELEGIIQLMQSITWICSVSKSGRISSHLGHE